MTMEMTRPLRSLTGVSMAALLLAAAVCALNCLAGLRAPAPQAQAEHGGCSMPAAPDAPQPPAPDSCNHHEAVAATLKAVAPLPVNARADVGRLPPEDLPPVAAAQTPPETVAAPPALRGLPFDSLLPLRI
jgi:hypothetical protein